MGANSAAAKTLVTAIMPVYNGAPFLADAIKSVLGQTHAPMELVVVDDGSTDATASILESHTETVKILRHAQRRGSAAARNRGIQEAEGDFLAFLDADDKWEPDKTRLQLSRLRAHPETEAIFGHVREFGAAARNRQRELNSPLSADSRAVLLGSMLIRKESFLRVGLLDESFEVGEFLEWFSRAGVECLQWQMLEQVVLHRRIHTTNQGITKRDLYRREYARALRMHLRRMAAAKDRDKGLC